MEKLPNDVLRKISLDLSPKDVLSLCLTNTHFNKTVFTNKDFWRNKINLDYPKQIDNVLYDFVPFYQTNPKQLYMIFSIGSK